TRQHAADRVDLLLDDPVGAHEVPQRELVVRRDLSHVVVPDERRTVSGKDVADRREVAVADPDAGDDGAIGLLGIGIGREEAKGLQVPEIVGGARLEGSGPSPTVWSGEGEARTP